MRRFTPLCLYVDEGYPIAEMLEGTGEYRHESDVIALEQELSKAKADQERFVWCWKTYWLSDESATIDQWRTYIDEQRRK